MEPPESTAKEKEPPGSCGKPGGSPDAAEKETVALLAGLGRIQRGEQVPQVVRVFLFVLEDLFHHPPGRDVALTQEPDDLSVRLDGDALGHEVFLDHFHERIPFHVLRMAACC